MATKSNIYKDPRWLSLVEKYKDNWVLAAKELFDIDLSHQQQQIVEAIQPNNAKATVTTPYGIGRPQVLAVISTLYTIMYPDSDSNCLSKIKCLQKRNCCICVAMLGGIAEKTTFYH
ncbi:hypothetical protein [Escherichia coli]|uniref:hypothetical protein n=1 Tax=Escherichia coli TaxID=562 RepID=UPI003890D0B6